MNAATETDRSFVTFRGRNGYEPEPARLALYWESNSGSISDWYDPRETTARELFDIWRAQDDEHREDVWWFVKGASADNNFCEFAPFQGRGADFLTYWTWPVHADGSRLNWLTLPVLDGCWNRKKSTKGGFIQEVLGWKPSPLQTHIPVDLLMCAAGLRAGS